MNAQAKPKSKPQAKAQATSKRRYKLLRGGHVHQEWREATPEELADENIKKLDRNGKKVILVRHSYSQSGNPAKLTLIESDVDLVQRFGPQKFAYADEPQSQAQPAANYWDDLESKSEEKLRALALFEEIDISGAKSKDEMIQMLRSAISGE